MPHIICLWIVLNILGNTIKITFKVPSKYIVWILLIFSILINFIFFKISFESFFVAFISFSFSCFSRSDVLHHLDAEIRENYFPVPVPDDVAICTFKFIEKGNNIAFMNVGRESRGESFLPFSHVYYFFNTKVSDKVFP